MKTVVGVVVAVVLAALLLLALVRGPKIDQRVREQGTGNLIVKRRLITFVVTLVVVGVIIGIAAAVHS